MYIRRIEIRNIRSARQIDWSIDIRKAPGWHVIIGDNGTGKSSFLRAIALALVGPTEAMALRQDWNSWLRGDEKRAYVNLILRPDKSHDKLAGRGAAIKRLYLPAGVDIRRTTSGLMHGVELKASRFVDAKSKRPTVDPKRHVWGADAGWFSASYGPFRRFLGGDKDYEKMFYTYPKLGRHLSVFGESVALTECLEWLKSLHFKNIEKQREGRLLLPLIEFINQEDFLPHRARLESISTDGVRFVDGNGCNVPVEQLSDGYRSILSMTLELIRQLSLAYGPTNVFDSKDSKKVVAPGVVLIDEVDAHLHPTWQRRVGIWFREHFPNVQFIVTSHSPLVCQAADHGTVFRLPQPGSEDSGAMVEGRDLNRLLYGNVLDAYGTELFGNDITRSEVAKAKLARLAELNQKDVRDQLSPEEQKEVQDLRAMMPTAASAVQAHDADEDE